MTKVLVATLSVGLILTGLPVSAGIVTPGPQPVDGAVITPKSVTITNSDIGADLTVNTSTMVVRDGRVGIGTALPATALHVVGVGASSQTYIGTTSLDTDLTGILVTNPLTTITNAGSNESLAFVGTGANGGSISANFFKTRSTSLSGDANTVVVANDGVMSLTSYGADGAAYRSLASIRTAIDGTPGSSDMPGRITFLTTPDGSATLAERMRIDNAGNVGIGTTNPGNPLEVVGVISSTGTGAALKLGQPGLVYVGRSGGSDYRLVMYTDEAGGVRFRSYDNDAVDGFYWQSLTGSTLAYLSNGGNLGIGTTGPTAKLHVAGLTASTTGQIIDMAASATANPFMVRDSGGALLAGDTSWGCRVKGAKNATGSTLAQGTIVDAYSVAAGVVYITTAAVNSDSPIGMVQDAAGCASGAVCSIGVSGLCYVKLATGQAITTVPGYFVGAGATAGQGDVSNSTAAPLHNRELGNPAQLIGDGATGLIWVHFN